MVKDKAPQLDPVPTLADIRDIAADTANIETVLPTPKWRQKSVG